MLRGLANHKPINKNTIWFSVQLMVDSIELILFYVIEMKNAPMIEILNLF